MTMSEDIELKPGDIVAYDHSTIYLGSGAKFMLLKKDPFRSPGASEDWRAWALETNSICTLSASFMGEYMHIFECDS